MFNDLIQSLRVAAVTITICAVGYPLAILGFAAAIAPDERLGSLIIDQSGAIRGSRLLAQGFTQPEYFWPRPSACDFNASAAAGSNLSPTNPALRERAESILASLDLPDGQPALADLVTASGGGLDPHISYEAAILQAPRVANARGISENEVLSIVELHVTQIPFSGEANSRLVHVLELNRALDEVAKPAHE